MARVLVAAALALAAVPAARGQTLTFSACVGDGCEFASGRPPPAPICAAAAMNPDTFHRTFARGCLAQRDFSRHAETRDAACAAGRADCPASRDGATGGVLDPVRLPPVDVVGMPEAEDAPSMLPEARFAAQLNRGNPEVNGGKMRHGAFHALGMYWGADPLSFLYYNVRYGLFD